MKHLFQLFLSIIGALVGACVIILVLFISAYIFLGASETSLITLVHHSLGNAISLTLVLSPLFLAPFVIGFLTRNRQINGNKGA